MFNNFSEEARKVIVVAKQEMKELRHPYVSSEHLLLAILKGKNNVSQKLKKYNLDYQTLKQEIINVIGIGSKESEWTLYTPVLKNIISNAIDFSKEAGSDVIVEYLFASLIDEGEGIAIRLLINLNIDLDAIYNEFVFKAPKKSKKKKLLLDELGRDLTVEALNNQLDPVIGRNSEIKRVMEILTRRNKNNPLLIGEAGVGKTAIVEELSRMIANNEVPNKLKNKHIVSLDMSSLVAGTKYRGEFEEKINKILREVEDNSDIILFIDEIHTLVGAGGAEGAIDASNIFKPALARNKIRCIGATTTQEYKKYMESDKALERRFQTVLVEEPNSDVVKEILNSLKPIYEDYHKVILTDEILSLIATLSSKYILNRKEPDRTIDILDEVCSHANLKENKKMKQYNELSKELYKIINLKKSCIINNNFDDATKYKLQENDLINKINALELELSNVKLNTVTKKDLEEVLNSKVKMPIYELSTSNINIDKIKKDLKREIIAQDDIINELVDLYSNNLNDNKCYSIMFSGMSGTGKTRLAQLFGNCINNNVIRLDMSEYSEAHAVSKLIGSPPGYIGYNDTNNIFEEIRTKPFTLLILDEIEKCHSSIKNLFFQILDNSSIKDAKGNTIYFNNVIIIMTTNICNKKYNLGFNSSKKNNDELNNYFGVPFINRIDKVLQFNNLTLSNIEKIINKEIKARNIKISNDDMKKIINKSNYEEYGARQISFILKEYVNKNKKVQNKKVKK